MLKKKQMDDKHKQQATELQKYILKEIEEVRDDAMEKEIQVLELLIHPILKIPKISRDHMMGASDVDPEVKTSWCLCESCI